MAVRIVEAQLCVRHVKLSDEKYKNIQQSLLSWYRIKCVVMKTHSFAQGISSFNWENAHVGQLPHECWWLWWKRMHAQEVLQGIHSNSNVSAYLKSRSILMRKCFPLKLNFADNQYIDGYRSLFATAGETDMNNGLDITRADNKSGYYSLPLCQWGLQERIRNGTLRVNIRV